MRAILRRVGRLEDRFETELSGKPKSGVRVIVARSENGAVNLATSTCTRRLNNAGGLIEIADLDGAESGISEEELEKFNRELSDRSLRTWEVTMNRTFSRRLERLETRAQEVAAARPEPHNFLFIEPVNKRVTSMFAWENGKQVWTHFDPPRERAEFEHVM